MIEYERGLHCDVADVFKALAHPIRVWIVRQLADGKEHCVCEFVDAVGVNFSTVSQHLSVLKQVGILQDEKRGKAVYYRISCPCIAEMIVSAMALKERVKS